MNFSPESLGDERARHVGAVTYVKGKSMTIFNKLLRDESGASAAEYALILAVVGVGIVAAAVTLSTAIGGAMTRASTTINANGR